MSQPRDRASELPVVIIDTKKKLKYKRGNFLGKGGFARCYEFEDMTSHNKFACKIISKETLKKENQKEKLVQEISIHQKMQHEHVVRFYSWFDDEENVYIILELCRRRSLMEMHKRRGTVTEPEARYFIHQIAKAGLYMHKNRVIHRDLKLGNLFLNDKMDIKVGDFGLATQLETDGDRKKTLCGTPNYIAPEVLAKKGHSYEVDMWSLGCILYTLLVGRPPFETDSLKETYARIKRCEYVVPTSVSPCASALIKKLLSADPANRGTMADVLSDPFIVDGYMPPSLPQSILSMAPRFDTLTNPNNTVVVNGNMQLGPSSAAAAAAAARAPLRDLNRSMRDAARNALAHAAGDAPTFADPNDRAGVLEAWLHKLMSQVDSTLGGYKILQPGANEEAILDPAATPIFWVSKWVDYSDKYGLGYQLCDNSVGVLFNDQTRLLLAENGDNMQYIDRDGHEYLYTLNVFADSLQKKVTLLKYFRGYMAEHLLKAGQNIPTQQQDLQEMTRMPFLRCWFRTRNAIVLHLSNGTLQINFFNDHTKIFLCPLMNAITYIDQDRVPRTYRLELLSENGMPGPVHRRLTYAQAMIHRMVSGTIQSAPEPQIPGLALAPVAAAPAAAAMAAPGRPVATQADSGISNGARTAAPSALGTNNLHRGLRGSHMI